MAQNEAKTPSLSATAEQVREFVKGYIGDKLIMLETRACGRSIFVNLDYEDFKPEREVRRHIEDAFPNVTIDDMRRSYSADAVSNAILDNECVIYVKEADGCLRPTTTANFVEEVLQHVDLSK